MSVDDRPILLHRITTRGPRRTLWRQTVRCPARCGEIVSTDRCLDCGKLHAIVQPDDAGQSWILCGAVDGSLDAVIDDAMSADVVCVSADLSANDALALFHENGFGSLVVVDDDGAPRGVVSRVDVVRQDATVRVGDVLRPVLTLHQELSPARAAARLVEEHAHSAAVVDDAGHVVGVLSALDLLRVFVAGGDEAKHGDAAAPSTT